MELLGTKYLVHLHATVRSILIDLRFGFPLFGYQRSDAPGHNWVVNTDYRILPHIFANNVSESDVIVDIGCGKGRVLNWLLLEGYRNKMIGIEYEHDVAERLKKRLRNFGNIRILHGNAVDLIPEDATLFYMFNPFDERVTQQFANRLKQLFLSRREIRILYYRPVALKVFKEDPVWHVSEREIPLQALNNDYRYRNSPSRLKYAVIEFAREPCHNPATCRA